MGSHAIQFLSQFPMPISHNYTTSRTRRLRCFSSGRSGGSRWNWDKNASPNRRSRFSDAYVADEYDEEENFEFRNAAKQRVWWSDDLYAEDDEEEDEGFGVLEASIGFNWVFKVFRAFGWMIPAVVISLLMGTGPNAIIMALALPLAQTVLSLAAETLLGRADETPRPKSRSKKRPFPGASGRTRVRKGKENHTQTRKEAGNYKSWFEANNVSGQKENRNQQNFGGWDELDSQMRVDEEFRKTPVKEAYEPRVQERIIMSGRRKGDTPLFMRLLIAMFPYLGFWTKLFKSM